MFTAILGCLLGEDWAEPRIEQLIVTDKCLLARTEGEVTHKLYPGGRGRLDPQRPRHCQGGGAGRSDELGYRLGAIAKIKRVE